MKTKEKVLNKAIEKYSLDRFEAGYVIDEALAEVGKAINDLEREEWGDDVILASKLKQKLGIK